ncbi:MAG: 2-oxoglutarate dehydrogenase E1 component [Bacteroidia bacterium]|nr:2-oxoglutarate dehydrogenase E1 component [Bacteroidia bacterium]
MDKFSFVGNADVEAIDHLYALYLKNPQNVDKSWHDFFKGLEFARVRFGDDTEEIPENIAKEFKVIRLIQAYRTRGHLFTQTNPVRQRRKYSPTLDIENFGLGPQDLDTVFQAGNEIGIGPATLSAIIDHLRTTYCRSIGVEYMYIRNPEEVRWLQEKLEKNKNLPNFSKDEKRTIAKKLIQATTFENYLATKFVGQKRFSLEGGEAFLPALNALMEHGVELGIVDYVIGMAHRGRLNVLANIMGKPVEDIFTEFEGKPSEDNVFDGDVKYHMGFSSDVISDKGIKVHISLTPNPSHLEAVDPVVEGITRAKIDNRHNGDFKKACPILIHGDAAIAGQGLVYEVIQMSQLEGYKTGGTVHFVINNQVGFTTNYTDGRSSTYCTDVAKVVLSPVFHVNGDDVESLCHVAKLAMEYRQQFHKDVFIDILCYRKYGHNEGDEPRFTQPVLYKIIATHPNPKEIYFKKLIEEGSIPAEELKSIENEYKTFLDVALEKAKKAQNSKVTSYLQGSWQGLKMATEEDIFRSVDTSVDENKFLELACKSVELPKDKKFFNKILRLFEERRQMIGNGRFDWAMGELMAYLTLMEEGHDVRFSGQDVERGTFSHRHAVVKIEDSEEEYTPLNNVGTKGKLHIYNSLLSEYAVLGFEYGYAYSSPHDLVIWEAQFGDFFNGAQIIIDQYLSSSEYKWRRMNGLVVLLPHGYEGQGPEHSSGRLERFLQLCAENNMQIVNATTPAQQFHVLRRQLKRDFRKPLICFTPKKLLRYPACMSDLKEFTHGRFEEFLDDPDVKNKNTIHTLVLCSGKIYYEIKEEMQKQEISGMAVIRFEQLYPLNRKKLDQVLKSYSKVKNYIWAQEEPENMGAWKYIHYELSDMRLKYVGRPAAASPATGFSKKHAEEVNQFFAQLFEKQKILNN